MPMISTNMGRILTEGSIDVQRITYKQMLRSGQAPLLFRGVVLEVISDPDLLTDEEVRSLANAVDNPEFLPLMTPNTVIAKIISSGQSDTFWNTILFPFWSSHIMTPIAPGEQIYAIYEDLSGTGKEIGFWLTRVHAYNTVEDANYTHLDRRFDPTTNRLNYTTDESANRPTATSPETFPNGGQSASSVTLPLGPDGTINPYDVIFDEAFASQYITPEPVPRWKKRPQEFILQGANNTLIMLGEDRNGPISGAIQPTPIDITTTNGLPRQAGAIDIVAGRGRYFLGVGEDPRGGNTTTNPAGQNSTAPLIVDNSRGFKETDKNPYRTTRENIANPLEGNPDPIYDAARVYIVQQSKVDENYKLIPSTGLEYPDSALANEQPPENGALGRSYVVAKADHVRLIARREPQKDTGSENIAGTVLIVREGAKNSNSTSADPNTSPTAPDGNLAYIYINKEGKLQVEANEIYLGRATDKEQPYVRYSVYKATIEELQDEINKLRDHIGNLEQTLETAFQAAVAVPYSNVASLFALANNVLRSSTGYNVLDTSIQQSENKIKNTYNENVKSTKIFGE